MWNDCGGLILHGILKIVPLFVTWFCFQGIQGCSSAMDASTSHGKRAIIDSINLALSEQDCSKAIASAEGIYNSAYSDNDVRMVTASAYGCRAKVNFFQILSDIAANAPQMAGPGFWSTLVKFFPSVKGQDHILEASLLATDALMATLNSGALVLPSFKINGSGFNPGSMFYTDRTADSNIYLLFIAMATIGASESRFGSPDAEYKKTKYLQWTTAAKVDSDGCTFASGIVNFFDALGGTKDQVSGNLSKTLNSIHEKLAIVIDNSCKIGCLGALATPTGDATLDPNSVWVASGCAITTCAKCPFGLRDRSKCTGVTTDEVSCAAAGLVNFINSSTLGWQGTPPPP